MTNTFLPTIDLDRHERGTEGHFIDTMKSGYRAARDAGREFVIDQAELARMLHVDRRTIVSWFARAYAAGRIMPFFRSVTDPATGERRRTANVYVVALSKTCRLIFQEQWQAAKEAAGIGASITAITIAARRVAARAILMKRRLKAFFSGTSPYVKTASQQVGEPHQPVHYTPARSVETTGPKPAKPSWDCRRCGTANFIASPRCYTCKTDAPERTSP